MQNHSQFTDTEFAAKFEDCTLDPTFFSHEAHIRLAWIYIQKDGVRLAISSICDQIQRFAAFHGVPQKYHETITIAAVRTVYHFILRSNASTFTDFIEEFPQLKTNFKSLLLSHYTGNIFQSAEAKRTYQEPNLLPFDPLPA